MQMILINIHMGPRMVRFRGNGREAACGEGVPVHRML